MVEIGHGSFFLFSSCLLIVERFNLVGNECWSNACGLRGAGVVANYGEPRNYGVDLIWQY